MPDPTASRDNVQHMTIMPSVGEEGTGGGGKAGGGDSPDNKPRKLTYQDAVDRWMARGYPKPSAMGMADNVMRESGGDPSAVGDGGTSRGLFQHHNTRKDELEAYAKKQGKPVDDVDVQFDFADQELKTKFPTLQKQLMAGTDRGVAEDSFKRIFERPASVMWQNKPDGSGPTLSSDRFRYSDYALDEHNGHPNTDVMMMAPQDYLDLSPDLEGSPFKSPSGRSLVNSVNKGDEIESIPSLDVRHHGNTATVTGQDGRHRALLAQQEGLDAIPVAMRKTGGEDGAEPTEIQGMSGNILPHPTDKAASVPRSFWQGVGDALIPRAEAAEPAHGDDGWVTIPEQGAQQKPAASQAADANGWVTIPDQSANEPDNMVVSAAKGAAAGLGKTVLGGQELLGKGMQAVSGGMVGRAGNWLVNDARKGLTNLDDATKADAQAHPWAFTGGELAGGLALPGGIAAKVGGNALKAGIIGGLATAATQPVGHDVNYWGTKARQAVTDTAFNLGGNALLHGVATAIAPRLREAAQNLLREGVQLTPGQMAGGWAKRVEDTLASWPVVGNTIRAAQQRSIQTFDRAAINRSLADINSSLPPGLDSGHDAIDFAEQQFKAAYNQTIPSMMGVRDPVFMGNLNNIIRRAHAQGTPTELPQEYINRLNYVIQHEIVGRFDLSGRISGDMAQKVGTRLDALIGPMIRSEDPFTQTVGYALRDADKAFDDMMRVHNRPLMAAKDRIDAGYAKFKTVQKASTYLGTHPDGTFTPNQLNRAVHGRDKSKDKSDYSTGDALMQDLANAARDVLPQKVPDSGTTERAILASLLGGVGHLEPFSAAGLGAAAAAYTRPAQRTLNMIADRLTRTSPTGNALRVANGVRMAAPYVGAVAGTAAANQPIPHMTIRPGDGQ